MPGCPGEPVVTTLVCFVLFCTRGCGCGGHPAFPAPSVIEGGSSTTRADSRRENAEACVQLFEDLNRRSERKFATRPSSFSPCGRRCLREARADEGSLSAETDPSPVANSRGSFAPPSPTRGEGKRAECQLRPCRLLAVGQMHRAGAARGMRLHFLRRDIVGGRDS